MSEIVAKDEVDRKAIPLGNKTSCRIQVTERYSTHWGPRNSEYTANLAVWELPAGHRWEMINCWGLECGLQPALLKYILAWFPQV